MRVMFCQINLFCKQTSQANVTVIIIMRLVRLRLNAGACSKQLHFDQPPLA